MSNQYLIPANNNKVVRSYTISEENKEWLEKHVEDSQRSKLVDALLTRYIRNQKRRMVEAQREAVATK
jgi:hypothetical protein